MQKLEDIKSVEVQFAPDKTIRLETGRVAGEAAGSVLLYCGETIILVTCCVSKEAKPDIDFFPLTVDFEERLYAVGRVPGSYNRREGKPNDKAVLASRLIDRPIRPLFPDGFYNDVQITATVISSDQVHQPDVLAMFGASAAVELAGLPFKGPIGAVRVGLIGGQFVVNPTYEEQKNSQLDLVVAGNEKNVLMVEAGANFVKEDVILAGIAFAQEFIKTQIAAQKELSSLNGVKRKEFTPTEEDLELKNLVESLAKEKLVLSIESKLTDKGAREALVDEAYKLVKAHFEALPDEDLNKAKVKQAQAYTKKLEKKLMRAQIMEKGERVDGRKCNEIRQIWCQAGLLPRAHGSGLFTRGSTQVLSVVTLGTAMDAKPIDGIWPEREQTYYHNYNFPPYSVGEARSARATGRREIGHGALAERALIPALPSKEDFPYVIRVVSDVLSSNGSTSMGSTCGSTLALMDAGVPLKSPISGIAMGLIMDEGKCAILSDIQGVEDFLGDMDFKVTGSREGVTAIQLDLKLPQGIALPVLKVALDQALVGRIHILEKMLEALDKPRADLSKYAPKLVTLQIDPDQIGGIIGPSGKNIKRLIEETGVDKIDISDDGTVTIAGSGEKPDIAKERIQAITMKILPGQEYKGFIARKLPIGMFVEIGPGKVGLLKAPGQGGNHRGRFGRGGDRDRQRQEEEAPASASPAVNFDEFQLDEQVLALVEGIDMKGRINLQSVRKLD